MRPRFPASPLFTALILSLGIAIGWWARGPDRLPAPPPQEASTPYPSSPWFQNESTETATLSNPRATTQAEYNAEQEPAPVSKSVPEQFRALLAAPALSEAMALYRETERTDLHASEKLKEIALQFLDNYLAQGDASALISLVDALLSVNYDDIDVLLVLAQHQMNADYFFEAANTFQLTFTYALTQSDKQPTVVNAFKDFVARVDDQLSAERRWRELSHFYETLQSLDLTEPRYQLRLAELYLQHGQQDLGHELLEHLSTNPAIAADVAALLKGAGRPPRERVASTEPRTDSFALTAIGSHFHLPLRLNRTTDVHLLIDTGASVTTLSHEAFDRLRHQTRFTELGPQIFNTAGGAAKGTVYRVDQLQLGAHTIPDVHIAVLDFSMPHGVDGLLGMNVLRHFRFQVDQDQARLHVQPR
ncbi:retropepsin-like aspartic protease [Marinimicrobium sp. ABcell2]|uniref:retropepsin-like aspartic protease n=1 Tax=Marinimicrobium sp. ABcell2 TaxID=3069751 RepID=UPI0027B6AEC7|nr:retropepsin-like aspartic protease [Marinimicrobium sp. ABcell2]MDQ2078448.1 retropepsin-like aspartic protease [Marinimicrobium sp. ABcell2]